MYVQMISIVTGMKTLASFLSGSFIVETSVLAEFAVASPVMVFLSQFGLRCIINLLIRLIVDWRMTGCYLTFCVKSVWLQQLLLLGVLTQSGAIWAHVISEQPYFAFIGGMLACISAHPLLSFLAFSGVLCLEDSICTDLLPLCAYVHVCRVVSCQVCVVTTISFLVATGGSLRESDILLRRSATLHKVRYNRRRSSVATKPVAVVGGPAAAAVVGALSGPSGPSCSAPAISTFQVPASASSYSGAVPSPSPKAAGRKGSVIEISSLSTPQHRKSSVSSVSRLLPSTSSSSSLS